MLVYSKSTGTQAQFLMTKSTQSFCLKNKINRNKYVFT